MLDIRCGSNVSFVSELGAVWSEDIANSGHCDGEVDRRFAWVSTVLSAVLNGLGLGMRGDGIVLLPKTIRSSIEDQLSCLL